MGRTIPSEEGNKIRSISWVGDLVPGAVKGRYSMDAVKLYLMREQRDEVHVHVDYVQLRTVPVIRKQMMMRRGELWL